jgi:DNA-binding MarR family transcriptional regulator
MPRNKIARKLLPVENSSPGLSFGELGELLGYRLRRAQMAMHRDYIDSIADLEVTQKQTAILWLISNNPGVSQADVASALEMDRPSMMAVIDRLQERGFITRDRSDVDRRRQELHLTPGGQSMLAKLKIRIAKHEQRMRSLFTAAELDALFTALRKFQQVMDQSGAAGTRQAARKLRVARGAARGG